MRVDTLRVQIVSRSSTDITAFVCPTGINYKAKYERSLREFSFKMKEQKREHEDITEELRENKKALERKVAVMCVRFVLL